jgi:hypothetical protein
VRSLPNLNININKDDTSAIVKMLGERFGICPGLMENILSIVPGSALPEQYKNQ